MSQTLYVTANSPGEISGFLIPVVAAARRALPAARITVILLPCSFATGREEEVARSIPGVDEVIPAKRLWQLLRGQPPSPPLGLFHLGGDLMYAAMLARQWRMPAWAYQWAQRKWDRWIQGYFVKIERDAVRLQRQGVAPAKIHVVGDLVVDAVRATLGDFSGAVSESCGGHPHIVFLPGSRVREVEGMTPFYLGVAEHVRAALPQARFSQLLSPYLDEDVVRIAVESPPMERMGGVRGTLDGWILRSASGTELTLVHREPLRAMAAADFVVTIPGTKTGEAASLGKPMLVLLPTNRLEEVPFHGLVGMLDFLPGGKHLKAFVMRKFMMHGARQLFSLPNQLAGHAVVAEFVGDIEPQDIARRVLHLVDEKSAAVTRRALQELYQPFAGAADRVMAVIAEDVWPSRSR